MRKKRTDARVSVSLFPFLSILACVIGSLTLILAGVVIGQMGGAGSDEQRFEKIKDAISSCEQENEALRG